MRSTARIQDETSCALNGNWSMIIALMICKYVLASTQTTPGRIYPLVPPPFLPVRLQCRGRRSCRSPLGKTVRLMARHQMCMPSPPLARRRRGSGVQGEGRAGVCAEQTRICNIVS